MSKVMMWVKLFVFLPAMYFSALHGQKQPFSVRFEMAKTWSSMVLKKAKAKLVVSDAQHIPLQDGMLFVANHQGSLDAFMLLAASTVPFTAVSKVEGAKIPVLGAWYRCMEVILFDRNDMRDSLRMVKECAERLKIGHNILIFPEGTRSYSNKVAPFKAGALKCAMIAKVPVVPVALIDGHLPIDVGRKRVKVHVVYGLPIHYEEYETMNSQQLADECQLRIVEMIKKVKGENYDEND